MARTFSDIGSGAVGGAATGAAFGPWGALAGGAIGGILGAFTEKPPTADELGILPIDAREMAQEFAPTQDEMATQRNEFATRVDQSSERTAENMIAAGMAPARAYAIANRNSAPSMARNERTQNAQRMSMMDSLARQFMPYQVEREEDILNYNIATQNQPGILESFIPLAADLYGSQGMGGIADAWGFGGAPKAPSAYNVASGEDDILSGYLGMSPNQDMPATHNFNTTLKQPTPYHHRFPGWENLDN